MFPLPNDPYETLNLTSENNLSLTFQNVPEKVASLQIWKERIPIADYWKPDEPSYRPLISIDIGYQNHNLAERRLRLFSVCNACPGVIDDPVAS